jgi:exodeoxyribonuclease V gamma subunit
MALQISYVERLADVLEPVREFLSRDGDLFARPRIVVPNAGTKAWLQDRLARKLGTSGANRDDGIVANLDILYPGAITSLLQPERTSKSPDPWSIDRLTFAVLDVIAGKTAGALKIPLDVDREPLLAARRIAGLFDEYHIRRPSMILEWERGSRVLSPTANDVQQDGHPVPASLRDTDHWQFEVWRAVQQRIASLSPPARRNVDNQPIRERLLIVGLESLSLPQLESLEMVGEVCEVQVILVHPTSQLRAIWSAGLAPLGQDLRDRPLQKLRDPHFPEGIDPLLPVWLSGAHELQQLLAARGTSITELPPAMREDRPDSLLVRLQRSIAAGRPEPLPVHDPATDRSVVIHRCHSLSRQAEVLHDALLEAFEQIEGLQPHDVAIVSPCLEKAVPHLEAVFQRTVMGHDKDGKERRIKLPLVVADRGICETSEAAELLQAVLAIPGSRASIDDVLAVAAHPLVRNSFRVDDDTVATWSDFLERTMVRWGLDADHRARHGLKLADNPDIHTWKLGLERMLLGAMLPDDTARPELGGVVPLTDLDPVDLTAINRLVRILDVLRALAAKVAEKQSVADLCDAIERALIGLCGEECPQLAEPLVHLGRLRAAAAGTAAEKMPVPFEDVRRLLETWLEEKSGRQPLRTGAITATSMVPLRGVPFKVICVIGYDDGAVGTGEADGDDLVARQQLIGDVDPRADQRRALLDCLLSAEKRLLITCNGRNAKSNKRVPLVTPLAELVDFAVRHGVARERYDGESAIEIDHPRQQLSRRNFEEGGVWKTGRWSHDRIAAEVLGLAEAEQIKKPEADNDGHASSTSGAESTGSVELSLLERLVKNPLSLFLKETLGIDTYRDDETSVAATLPTVLEKSEARKLTCALFQELIENPASGAAWVEAKQRSGELPVGPQVRRQVEEIVALAKGLAVGAEESEVRLKSLASKRLEDASQVGKYRIVGELSGIHATPDCLVTVIAAEAKKDKYGRPLHVAALHLLAARAAGIDVDSAILISRRDGWKVGDVKKPSTRHPQPRPVEPWQVRVVTLAESLMPQAAAAARLDAIVGLALEATKSARPAFGKVLTAGPEKREEEFEKTLATPFYGRTSECAFFGMEPSFDDVFANQPERLNFLDAVKRLLEPAHDKHVGKYILT